MGITKFTNQIVIPAKAIPVIWSEKAPIIKTAIDPRTPASEKANAGVRVTKR